MDRIDRYIVEGVLGEGAMGRVLRVRHADLGTLHALKLLTLSAELAGDRFLQEARIQAHLRHPNVVGVTDFVRADGPSGS
ncbi:MAG: hypothetical protein H6736_21655 [Alphaproteobacteria bacterium]|nr:hypothetical protein [Alphaproteobacteria bacterium]